MRHPHFCDPDIYSAHLFHIDENTWSQPQPMERVDVLAQLSNVLPHISFTSPPRNLAKLTNYTLSLWKACCFRTVISSAAPDE